MFVSDALAALVDMVGGCEAAIFNAIAKDFSGKPRLGMAETEEFVEVGYAAVVSKNGRGGGKVAIDGKSEGAADGWVATNDFRSVIVR